MDRIQHILTATDLSQPSLHAVDRGFTLAQALSARYTILRALGLDALGPLRNLLGEQTDDVTRNIRDGMRAQLEALVADPQRNPGLSATLLVEDGMATSVVPRQAATSGADLVIVGARGDATARRMLVGSTAAHLLRKSPVPVLVVKVPGRQAYHRVLLPIDFSPASERTIQLVRAVAPGADLILLNIFDVPFEGMLQYAGVSKATIEQYREEAKARAQQKLHELAHQAGLPRERYTAVVEHGDATRTILDRCQRHGCDLIAMGKHGTHVTEELLLGSVTLRVLDETETDLLVVVDQRKPEPDAI